MQGQPIRVHVTPYRGRDPRKRARLVSDIEAAQRLETYLNGKRVEGEPVSLMYYEIARELGMDIVSVERLLFPVGGGDNGITI